MNIRQARTANEIEIVGQLFREYEAFLGVDLDFQSFEEELAGLPGKYQCPDGELLIGQEGNQVLGCVALRRLDEHSCEMKRLYVRPEGRGTGLGRQLAEAIIASARDLGYATMRLDTLGRLSEAMQLYESLGFRKTEAYYDNPLSGVVYWALDLSYQATP